MPVQREITIMPIIKVPSLEELLLEKFCLDPDKGQRKTQERTNSHIDLIAKNQKKGHSSPEGSQGEGEEEQQDLAQLLARCACKVFFTSKGEGDKFDKIWLLANAPPDLFIRNDIWQKLDRMCSSRLTTLNKLTGFINVSLFFSVFNPSSRCTPV